MKNYALFDYSNLAKRCLFTPYVKLNDTDVDYNMWRYVVWNSIFSAVIKLKCNGVILAGDKSSWRKIIYPAYKADRRLKAKKNKELGIPDIDWNEFNNQMRSFANELKDNLPFMFLEEDQCEADDIIAILCNNVRHNFCIISVDSDYKQLTINDNVKQYDPLKKKFIDKIDDLDYWINYMSLKGQPKDNIYNVVTLVDFPLGLEKARKPVFTETKVNTIINEIGIDKWINDIGISESKKKNLLILEENKSREFPKILLEENISQRYKINKKIIDFREIPIVLKDKILKQYDEYKITTSDDFYPFFKKMGWNEVLDNYNWIETTLLKMF